MKRGPLHRCYTLTLSLGLLGLLLLLTVTRGDEPEPEWVGLVRQAEEHQKHAAPEQAAKSYERALDAPNAPPHIGIRLAKVYLQELKQPSQAIKVLNDVIPKLSDSGEKKAAKDLRKAARQLLKNETKSGALPKSSQSTAAPSPAAPSPEAQDEKAKSVTPPPGMVLIKRGTHKRPAWDLEPGEPTPPEVYQIADFYLDTTEVTVAAYQACVDERACSPAATATTWPGISEEHKRYFRPEWCNANRSDRRNHPINCVTRDDAKQFCRQAGKRLPTEAEWEYAAQGHEGRRYPWGNAAPDETRVNACGKECAAQLRVGEDGRPLRAIYDGNDGAVTTSPVGSKPLGATPEGLLDMSGNVWEWTSSIGIDVTRASRRGGSWHTRTLDPLQTTSHYIYQAGAVTPEVGFRCAKNVRK